MSVIAEQTHDVENIAVDISTVSAGQVEDIFADEELEESHSIDDVTGRLAAAGKRHHRHHHRRRGGYMALNAVGSESRYARLQRFYMLHGKKLGMCCLFWVCTAIIILVVITIVSSCTGSSSRSGTHVGVTTVTPTSIPSLPPVVFPPPPPVRFIPPKISTLPPRREVTPPKTFPLVVRPPKLK
jgi:hypothetical protein